jgi:putative PIN family toxin of toxin-antitoxin system
MFQPIEKRPLDLITTANAVGEPTRLVLDTNVILDWLVFADPLLSTLGEAVSAGQLALYTHTPALDELQRVLGYAAIRLESARQAAVFELYQRQVRSCALPTGFALTNLMLPAGFPACKDPDDQHFLALTFHTHADALVTRDRAVLALRKRARKFGVTIVDVRQLPAFLAQGT